MYMVRLNKKDVRLKLIEELMITRPQQTHSSSNSVDSLFLSVFLPICPILLFECHLAFCHAAQWQCKELPLKFIYVMITTKHLPISKIMNEPCFSAAITYKTINFLLTNPYLHDTCSLPTSGFSQRIHSSLERSSIVSPLQSLTGL